MHPSFRRSCRLTTLLLAACTAAACSSGPALGPGPAKPRTSDFREVESFENRSQAMRAVGYRIDWRGYPFVGPNQSPLTGAAGSDIIAFMDTGATVTALKASDGSQVWSTQVTAPGSRFVDLRQVGSQVFASSESELFILDAQSGTLVDRQRLDPVVNTHAVAAGGLMVYGTSKGELLGHTLDVKAKLWGVAMDGAITRAPVLIGSRIGCVSDGGEIVFVDARTGRRTGDNRIYRRPGAELGSDDRHLYVASEDQTLYAFSADTGRMVWKHLTANPIKSPPVAWGGVVYCELLEEGLTAFDAASGDVLWANSDARGDAIAVRNGRLVIWDGEVASVIDRQRGDLLKAIRVDNVQRWITDGFEDGTLLAIDPSGAVTRFASTR